MGKKIKIGLLDKDNLEFELLEDAQKGDTFSLNELSSIDFTNIYKKIDQKNDEIYSQKLKEKESELYEKFLHSEEYISLSKKIDQLEYEKKVDNENYQKSLKFEIESKTSELNSRIMLLNKEIEEINNKNSILLKNKELELQNLYDKQINDLKNQLEKKEFEHKQKIEEIERKRNQNIKLLGNELEQWISDEYNNSFGVQDDCVLERTNKTIEGTKPDFLFKVIDTDGSILGSVTIEAKSQHSTSNTSTKNEQYYPKLENDRKKNNSEFSLLITELEPNDSFIIKKINDVNYQNMFVVRPSYFLVFLSIIKFIYLKRKSIKIAEMNFKAKQQIIEDFNNLKNEILTNSIKNINGNLSNILKASDSIKKEAQKIDDLANTALNSHLNTIKNKIEGFKIVSIINKIEKANN